MDQINILEKRVSQRVEFFRVRLAHEFVPVFAFAPNEDQRAIAAVVVDMSKEGVQILSSRENQIAASFHQFALSGTNLNASLQAESWPVRHIWSRVQGMYLLSGFSFSGKSSIPANVIAQLNEATHHLLPCVLRPIPYVERASETAAF